MLFFDLVIRSIRIQISSIYVVSISSLFDFLRLTALIEKLNTYELGFNEPDAAMILGIMVLYLYKNKCFSFSN